ncbi:MAG: DUF2007 domain-containing protein [Vicinamibacterales bacterium]
MSEVAMFCPNCEEEYTWDVMVCPVCDVDTVDRLPGPEATPDAELVEVFAASDPGLIALAHSLLEGETIDYFVRGDGTSHSFARGSASFWVRAEDAENARALLRDLASGGD